MEFNIKVKHNRDYVRLLVTRVYQDEYTERYSVASNGHQYIFERIKSVTLHLAVNPGSRWRLVEPGVLHGLIKEDIIEALKKEVE